MGGGVTVTSWRKNAGRLNSVDEVAMDAHWATLWEAIADRVPTADAVVQGERRLAWGALDDRASRLAQTFLDAGLGPGSKVALYLYNAPEYIEAYFAALKIRAVPVNVNYRYVAEELAYLLVDSDAEAIVFHTSLAERAEQALARAHELRLAVAINDGAPLPDGAQDYEALIANADSAARTRRSRDDLTLLYTGGTTGMPKGVMGRVGPALEGLLAVVPTALGTGPVADPGGVPEIAARLIAEDRQPVNLVACPLMHGTGLVMGMHTGLLMGGTVALLASRHFDAHELWRTAQDERALMTVVVGDPFARPMAQALEEPAGIEYDLDGLRYLTSSGAMFSHEVRERLVRRLPRLTIFDYMSSSEGQMALAISTAAHVMPTGGFVPVPGVQILNDDDQPVRPGSGEIGRVGLAVGVPDGYYKDEVKAARTFRTVDGVRYSFPGDWATVEVDGSLSLLGRGSHCINTGGEKVFPEEVEEALKRHPAIEDCLVFGEADDRFGERIIAIASLIDGREASPEAVLAAAGQALAAYKVPRHLAFVETIPRAPNGKADYPAARELVKRDGHDGHVPHGT
jgi:acyl-CoA synthetase (AMP-forming)/AMP-acid ligase II